MITIETIKEMTAFSETEEAKYIQHHVAKVARSKVISGYLFEVLQQIEKYLEQGYKLQPLSEFNQISPRSNGYLQMSLLIPDEFLKDDLTAAELAGKEEYKSKLESDKQMLLEQLIKEEEEQELQAQVLAQEQRRLERKVDLLKIIK